MNNKIFVGGLSWGTDSDGLREACAEYGEVKEARVITDRDTGRSRGFGFVTFEAEEDAAKAIEGMNGSDLDGRTLRVNIAEDRRASRGPRNRY